MMRQINSVVKLTVPTIGTCARDQITAIASSTQRVATRLTMKPTTMAEIENRKKNEEPSRPNCSGCSFNSSMTGAPPRPTTILSAKFTSMNRNSRNVIFQAPLGVSLGVGCVVMTGFSPLYLRSFAVLSWPVEPDLPDASHGFPGNATADFWGGQRALQLRAARDARLARNAGITIPSSPD